MKAVYQTIAILLLIFCMCLISCTSGGNAPRAQNKKPTKVRKAMYNIATRSYYPDNITKIIYLDTLYKVGEVVDTGDDLVIIVE